MLVTPREEEPQINVTMANVIVPFPGASARRSRAWWRSPMEQVLAEIDGVKHIYSVSRPGVAVLTVQFEVGEARTDGDRAPLQRDLLEPGLASAGLGVGQPLVKPKGIDDVPIMSADAVDRRSGRAVPTSCARSRTRSRRRLKRVPGTRDVYTIGGARPTRACHARSAASRRPTG